MANLIVLLIIGSIFFQPLRIILALVVAVLFIPKEFIIFIVITGIIVGIFSNNTSGQGKSFHLKWRGRMRCNTCNYLWISRRPNPPAKCANCGSKNIFIIQEP